jgi:hypothetical protein
LNKDLWGVGSVDIASWRTTLADYKGTRSEMETTKNPIMHLPSCMAALSLALATAISAHPFDLPPDYDKSSPPSGKVTWGHV